MTVGVKIDFVSLFFYFFQALVIIECHVLVTFKFLVYIIENTVDLLNATLKGSRLIGLAKIPGYPKYT